MTRGAGRGGAGLAVLACLCVAGLGIGGPSAGHAASGSGGDAAAAITCTAAAVATPLPIVAKALRVGRKLKILMIRGSAMSNRELASGRYAGAIETMLESAFKGVDVEVMHRGVSGELVEAAGHRIRNEVALSGPALVLWQVGTGDGLARVPVDQFRAALSDTVQWLRRNGVDVVLVGLHYSRALRGDTHYQSIRKAVLAVATEQKVLRIGRYEAAETVEKMRGPAADAGRLSQQMQDAGYDCVAVNLVQGITAVAFPPPVSAPPPRRQPPR